MMTITNLLDSERGKVWFYTFVVDFAIIWILAYFLGDVGSRSDSFWILSALWLGIVTVFWVRRTIVRRIVTKTTTRPLLKEWLDGEFNRLERPDSDFSPITNRTTDWLQCYSENSAHSPDGRVVAARLSGELEIGYSIWDPFGPAVGEEAWGAMDRFQKSCSNSNSDG